MTATSPFSSSFVIYGNEIIPIYAETVCFEYPMMSPQPSISSPRFQGLGGEESTSSTSTNMLFNNTTISASQESAIFMGSDSGLVLQSVDLMDSDDDSEVVDMTEGSDLPVTSLLSPSLFRNAIQCNHSSAYYQHYGMFRPARKSMHHVADIQQHTHFLHRLYGIYGSDRVDSFQEVKLLLSLLTACMTAPNTSLLCAALDCSLLQLEIWFAGNLSKWLELSTQSLHNNSGTGSSGATTAATNYTGAIPTTASGGAGHHDFVGTSSGSTSTVSHGLPSGLFILTEESKRCLRWLCSTELYRIGQDFWVDISLGHNLLCALYLKHCGNKSVAVEQSWQQYLQTYGPLHLRRSSRGLRLLTSTIRKIDETANIKSYLPYQLGYISGLQEIYARRVGLSGMIPKEIGQLTQLRVLSMGNNRLTGQLPIGLTKLQHLQRIVLHQNNLIGKVPDALSDLGCIVNLAGNPRLEYGPDVSVQERNALIDFFFATKGPYWNTKTFWITSKPVCKWYKVSRQALTSLSEISYMLI
jgi:hypothetical protein